jgi:hypothetical protein
MSAADELATLEAIYGDEYRLISNSNSNEKTFVKQFVQNGQLTVCSVQVGVRVRPDVELLFTLPETFPNDPPVVELPSNCTATFDANECSIFAIVESIREQLSSQSQVQTNVNNDVNDDNDR